MENMHGRLLRGAFNPLSTALHIYRSRDLLLQLTRRNIQTRYRGTSLGLLWWFASPLLLLAVYTFVFSVVFQARWGVQLGESRAAFALIMFCGLVVFNVFAESMNGAVSVVRSNPNYVKKVVFPLEVLPLSAVLTALFSGLVWFFILIAALALLMQKVCVSMVSLPLILIPFLLCCCGLAWFVASVGVYVPDLPHAVAIALQVLFFMTPIFYSIEMVPEPFRSVLVINPLSTVVESVRRVLIYDQWPHWPELGVAFVTSVAVFQMGFFWFMKTKRGFADVL